MEYRKAYFAGGCFWGVQYYFDEVPGVIRTRAGYMGGTVPEPTYEQVKTGTTGHAETVEVTYDPDLVSYEELAKLFFEIHDPTQLNRQGLDVGTQYRSVIFYCDEDEKRTAEKLISELRQKGLNVVTALEKAGKFWEAEDYHQHYYKLRNQQPTCHVRVKRF